MVGWTFNTENTESTETSDPSGWVPSVSSVFSVLNHYSPRRHALKTTLNAARPAGISSAIPQGDPMPSRARTLAALALLPLLPHDFGGWAVVTVRDLPDHVIAGQPLEIGYAVRQHGVTLLPGLHGRVVAREAAGGAEVAADATPLPATGHYAARLVLPRAGAWTVTIGSGFMTTRATLLPLRVVAPGSAAVAPLADAERGRQLFVAKGCVTCHSHAASGAPAEMRSLAVGPDLTERRLPAEYLARFLADPSVKTTWATDARMPALELAPREIAALVAFLDADRRVSRR